METHSSILAWEIPWREEPGGIRLCGHKRVRHDLATKQQSFRILPGLIYFSALSFPILYLQD